MTQSAPDDRPDPSFEAALRELENIVRRLENGEVPLDESITLYEEGEKLRQLCQTRLDAAQARIERIVTAPNAAGVSMSAGNPISAGQIDSMISTRPFDDGDNQTSSTMR